MLSFLFLSSYLFAFDKAIDFTLKDINNKPQKLSELLKKGPVLVDFWATWCKPCLEALPSIEKIHQTYSKKGLQVLAISIDDAKNRAKVRPLIKSAGYSFTVLYDENMEVRKSFGGTSVPLTILIDQDGSIIYNHLGYVRGDEKKLEEVIFNFFKNKELSQPNEDSSILE